MVAQSTFISIMNARKKENYNDTIISMLYIVIKCEEQSLMIE